MIQDNTRIQSIIVKLSGVSTGTIQNLLLDLAHSEVGPLSVICLTPVTIV